MEVYEDEDGAWIVYCTREVLATYRSIVSAQRELDLLSGSFWRFL